MEILYKSLTKCSIFSAIIIFILGAIDATIKMKVISLVGFYCLNIAAYTLARFGFAGEEYKDFYNVSFKSEDIERRKRFFVFIIIATLVPLFYFAQLI